MNSGDRIECKPDVMLRRPVTRGTRFSFELILDRLSQGASVTELLEGYPHLTQQNVFAALADASTALSKEEVLAA